MQMGSSILFALGICMQTWTLLSVADTHLEASKAGEYCQKNLIRTKVSDTSWIGSDPQQKRDGLDRFHFGPKCNRHVVFPLLQLMSLKNFAVPKFNHHHTMLLPKSLGSSLWKETLEPVDRPSDQLSIYIEVGFGLVRWFAGSFELDGWVWVLGG
jgi:hypothetical protein